MIVNKNQLLRKMLVTPRLNLKCDGVKIRMAYVSNAAGNGWLIENLNNDGKTKWFEGKFTKEIVEMITDIYKEINITWSKSF